MRILKIIDSWEFSIIYREFRITIDLKKMDMTLPIRKDETEKIISDLISRGLRMVFKVPCPSSMAIGREHEHPPWSSTQSLKKFGSCRRFVLCQLATKIDEVYKNIDPHQFSSWEELFNLRLSILIPIVYNLNNPKPLTTTPTSEAGLL